MIFYIKINAFYLVDGCIPASHFVCWVLFYAFLLSLFFNHLFKISFTEEQSQIVNMLDPDQFNKISGLIWTNHAFCKDNKQKAIAVLTH